MRKRYGSLLGLVMFFVVLVFGMVPALAQDGDLVEVVIINTSDEHGWLQPFTPFGSGAILGGAANILSWWDEFEDYDPDSMLLLSSGDNWTGPSISTWFEGEPMVEAFNLMGYDASAVGNHEFDFGREVMARRMAEADYPYVGANIRFSETGELADFVEPYVILEANGVQVGVIGLSTTDTPFTTHPVNISDLEFVSYAETLESYVPQMREDGAEVIVVLAHACQDDLVLLARQTGEMVDVMFSGHCNEFGVREVNGVTLVGSGAHWQSYARVTLFYNSATGEVENVEPSVVQVSYAEGDDNPVEPNAEMQALVDEWQDRADEVLSQEIGYTAEGIAQRSWRMANWVTDAWLWVYPQSDVAVTNFGGFRQAIPAGAITWADVVGVLPFDNNIYEVHITGAELAENLACCGGAVGGISYVQRGRDVEITFLDGREFDPEATYTVLVSDFMYFGGDGYLFEEQDPDVYDTGIHWRQPVIDWTAQLATTPDDPLDDHLDSTPRR